MTHYTGSCHCGAVVYRAALDLSSSSRCNCSFCTKSRYWLAFTTLEGFELVKGADALTDYQWTPPGKAEPFLHQYFCKHCGMRPFTKGGHLEKLGGEFYAINLASLDISEEERAKIPFHYLDGRTNDWEHPPAHTSHL